MIPIQDTSVGASFAVRIHPRAKKSAITGELGDALKLSLTAPASDGRANHACIEFLANLFEGSAFLRYHSVRPDQPQEGYPCGRIGLPRKSGELCSHRIERGRGRPRHTLRETQ